MCTELLDPERKVGADTPAELAALIGAENIVWHAAYLGHPWGNPSMDDPTWRDACLCPVDIEATMAKAGGKSHGYGGESGYYEITLPA